MCFLWLDQSIIIHKEKPWINNSYITSCVPCAFPLKKYIYIIKSENEIKEDSLKTVAMDELVVRSYRIVVAITRVSGGGILGSDCWNLGWEVGWFLHPFSCKGRFTLLTSQKGRVTLYFFFLQVREEESLREKEMMLVVYVTHTQAFKRTLFW